MSCKRLHDIAFLHAAAADDDDDEAADERLRPESMLSAVFSMQRVRLVRKEHDCMRTTLLSLRLRRTLSASDHRPLSCANSLVRARGARISTAMSEKVIERICGSRCSMSGTSHVVVVVVSVVVDVVDKSVRTMRSSQSICSLDVVVSPSSSWSSTAVVVVVVVVVAVSPLMQSWTSSSSETCADLVMKLPMKESERPPRPTLNVLMICTRLFISCTNTSMLASMAARTCPPHPLALALALDDDDDGTRTSETRNSELIRLTSMASLFRLRNLSISHACICSMAMRSSSTGGDGHEHELLLLLLLFS